MAADRAAGVPLIVHAFPTFQIGGAQVRLATIVNALGARYRHRIVAIDGTFDAASLIGTHVPAETATVPAKKGNTLASAMAFRRALAAWRPAVLVTYNWGATEWALANLACGLPHIHIEDGFGPDEALRQLPRRALFRRAVLSWRSRVVLPSKTLLAIAGDVWRLPRSRLLYIPNGIDCARFAAGPDPALAAALPGAGPVVGTVATLRAEKNLRRLIRAFARVAARRPARLVIAGDGPERPALMAEAERAGVAALTHFPGRVQPPERIVGAFDVFALSSDTEQMPLSILEAMAAGLPIAATDVGDIMSMVAEPNRPLLVAREDEEGLAEAIGTLLDDPGRARSLGAANRARAEAEYAETRMVASYDALFTAAAGRWRAIPSL